MSVLSRSKKNEAPSTAVAVVGKSERASAPLAASSPRANLLPPEIGQRNAARGARRLMVVAVVLVMLIAGGGVAGAFAVSLLAQADLVSAQSQSARLAAQQRQYADVDALQQRITLGTAAQSVGGSTDIDWQAFLQQLQTSLPSGVTITTLQVDSAGVTEAFGESDRSTVGTRVADITFTAQTSTLPSIPDWLNSLSDLPGYVNSEPGSVDYNDGNYQVSVGLVIDKSAYTHQYDTKEAKK